VRLIAFNAAEGWSRDVSEDVAHEVAPISAPAAEPTIT
jgi:hypothetical protein